MGIHSAIATLEPQKYVISRTFWTENILLVRGRLVQKQNVFSRWGRNSKQGVPGGIRNMV